MSAASLVRSLKQFLPCAVVCGALLASASAGDFRINLPKRTKPTPVQALNRDGVRAVQKHDYEKAKRLFYRAYLLDPDDPFTLNNLGYMAELDGDVERAQRFYDLSKQMDSDALVDKATTEAVVGQPVAKVAGNAGEQGLQVNRLNVAAIGLLQKDRAPEADVLLTKALQLEPNNPFTLNNLGFAKEQEGDLESALHYYTQAANTKSDESVVVTVHSSWRGKPIRDIAQGNAEKVRNVLSNPQDVENRVARLNLEGVSALNRNDRRAARQYFQQAYQLKKDDAFALNNMGYLAELDGDRETANYFYEKAQAAQRANERVGTATRKEAEGQPLTRVASASSDSVDARIQQALEAKRREGGPVVLHTRSGAVIAEPPQPKHPSPKEGGDVVSIPIPKNGAAVITPEAGATEIPMPSSTTTEQPATTPPNDNTAQPPQQQQQPQQEPTLVQPQELDQPPNVTTSNPQTPQQPPK
jgi:Flp pilus assembly protein TadD